MTEQKASRRLFWSLFFIYTVNVLGKTSFSAATVSLINEAILTKTQAGLISGIFWLAYAVGQFAGGFFTERINSYTLIKITIISSMAGNMLMAYERNFFVMLLTWGLNGVLQFGLWPAVLKLVSTEIIPAQREKAREGLAACFCLGSILSYVLATCVLAVSKGKTLFICCGIITGGSYVLASYAHRRLSPVLQVEECYKNVTQKKGNLSGRLVWESGLVFFCLLMVIKSIVDNGIKNWMPTIMLEVYDGSPSFSSFLSVELLVTNFFGVFLTSYIYHKVKCDELLTLRRLYVIAAAFLLLLLDFRNMNMYICTVLLSGATILVYGSTQILQLHYPNRFHAWGLMAEIGGIINAFAAVGNMIATYGCGYIADHFGWDVMMRVWNMIVILFVIITILLIPLWKKFRIIKN